MEAWGDQPPGIGPREVLNFKSVEPHSGSGNMALNVNREEYLETWLKEAPRSKEEREWEVERAIRDSHRDHAKIPATHGKACDQGPHCCMFLVIRAPRRPLTSMEEQTEMNKGEEASQVKRTGLWNRNTGIENLACWLLSV